MIPYPYNMVDMGGVDLAEANGTVVEGLYSKIVEALDACGDVVLYNWKFAEIEIAPQHTQILVGSGELRINTLIQVTEQDEVNILGIDPPQRPVEPLSVTENGLYTATPPMSGFNPVEVAVPPPALGPLVTNINGVFVPSDYDLDGFNSVTVQTPAVNPRIIPWDISGETYLTVNNSYLRWATYNDQRVFVAALDPGKYEFVRDQAVSFTILRYSSAELLSRMAEIIEKSLEPAPQNTDLLYLGGPNSFSGNTNEFSVSTRTAVLFYIYVGAYSIDPIIYKIS